jgi:hypothetical protein
MKKYLMTGMAALAICAAFTSCSKDIEQVTQEQINQANAQKILMDYENAFIKAFGQPAANQDWGFGVNATRGTASGTSVLKHDMVSQGYPIEREPAPLAEAHDGYKSEKQFVTEWFQTHDGLTPEGLDIENFFLQYVSGDDSNKPGKWYNPDGSFKQTFTANGQMDYLVVGESMTDNVHVNDFNAKSGGPFGVIYIKNGSAKIFGYHSSYGEAQYSPTKDGCYYDFKLARIDVPGVGEGWYVGLSLYAKKYDNGIQILGEQRHDYAEDWILKIIPDDPTPSADGRIIAEDLTVSEDINGTVHNGDFDFNDVVFDYKYTSTGVDIILRAAGGTLPLRLAGSDNYEVHKLLGVGPKDMVNTGRKSVAPVSFSITGNFDSSKNGNDIKIEVNKGTEANPNWIELKAEQGRAPGKVRVDIDYNWCAERQDIDEKYSATHNRFSEYVGGQWAWNTWYNQAD